jgi:signal transduction histidine kinase
VFIQLGKKESGDVFTARDTQVMSELAQQSERLLLKLRNQELVIQRQAAEQLAAEKSLFLASASHDLRQPMHALGLFSESLSKRNRDERLAPLVEHINRSTKALDGMFNSILDLSKIDAGAMTAESGAVYIQLLFEELELEFADIAKAKDLDLRFVPSSAVVWSDANLLARILRNLISNAIRYTEKGKVLVGCRLGQNGVRVQVADTGKGISAADQKRILPLMHAWITMLKGGWAWV